MRPATVIAGLLCCLLMLHSEGATPVSCTSTVPAIVIIDSFGEYVWNCSSSSGGLGGGDTLRIIVPSGAPATPVPGLLSVVVALSTFDRIIVELASQMLSANITIELCGAVVNGSAAPMVHLVDRPAVPAVLVTSNATGNSTGTVTVSVVVSSNVHLVMRNTSSLVSIDAVLSDVSWLEVALELRSNCRVELYDVAQLLGVVLAQVEGVVVRFVGVDAEIVSTTSNMNSVAALVAVLPRAAQQSCTVPSSGGTTVVLTRCNVTVAHPRQFSIFLAETSVTCCISSNTSVDIESSEVVFQAPLGYVVLVVGDPIVNVSFARIVLDRTLVLFVARGVLLGVSAVETSTLESAVIVLSRSNVSTSVGSDVVTGNGWGALLCCSSLGVTILSSVTMLAVNSIVHFNESGYLAAAVSSNLTDVRNISITMQSSDVAIFGSTGALLNCQSNGSVLIIGAAVKIDGANLRFDGNGFLVFLLSTDATIVHNVSVAVSSTNLIFFGPVGSLCYCVADNGSVLVMNTHVVVTGGSFQRYFGDSRILAAVSSISTTVCNATVAVQSSTIAVSAIGSLVYCRCSNGSVQLNDVGAVSEGSSSHYFYGDGCFVFAKSATFVVGRNVRAIVRGSNVSFNWTLASLCFFECFNGSVVLDGVEAAITNASNAVLSSNQNSLLTTKSSNFTDVNHLTAVITSSEVTFAGEFSGLIASIPQGGLRLSNVTAAVLDFSVVQLFGHSGFVGVSATADSVIQFLSATISYSNVTFHDMGVLCAVNATSGTVRGFFIAVAVERSSLQFLGSVGALLYVINTLGSSSVEDAVMIVNGSNVRFDGIGYVLLATSVGAVIVNQVNVTATASNITLNVGSTSSLVHLESIIRGIAVADVRISVLGGSVVAAPQGSVLYVAQRVGVVTTAPAVPITVVVVDSVISVSRVLECRRAPLALSTPLLRLNTSLIVLTAGGSLTAGLTSVSVIISGSMLCLSLSNGFVPLNVSQSVTFTNVSLESRCNLIGWYDKSLDLALLMNSVAKGQQGAVLRHSRMLRKLDVAGASLVSVSADGCAWGPGSHEFRVTETLSESNFRTESAISETDWKSASQTTRLTNTEGGTDSRSGLTPTISVATRWHSASVSRPIISLTRQQSLSTDISQSYPQSTSLSSVPRSTSEEKLTMQTGSASIITTDSASHSHMTWSGTASALFSLSKSRSLHWSTTIISSTTRRSEASPSAMSPSTLLSQSAKGTHSNYDSSSHQSVSHSITKHSFFSDSMSHFPTASFSFAITNRSLTTSKSQGTRSPYSIPLSSTRIAAMTITKALSLSHSRDLVVGAHRLDARLATGSPLLFVATSASILSSYALGVAGIQTVEARGAVLRQCSGLQDGGDSTAPLSDPASNPFGIMITSLGAVLMFAGGSVASFLLLGVINVVAVVVAVPLFRGPRRWLRRVRQDRLLVALSLPGSLYSPLMLVLQPLTTDAAVLLVSPSRGTASIALGLCLTVTLAAVVGTLLAQLREGRALGLVAWKPTWHSGPRNRGWFQALLQALGDSCECAAANPHDPASRQHVERYGAILSSYAGGREWFVAVEVAVASASGVLSGVALGLDPSVACSKAAVDGFNWALVSLYLTLFVSVTTLRPYSSLLGNLLSCASSMLSTVCLVLQSLSPDSPLVAELLWAQGAAGFLPMLVVFFPIVILRTCSVKVSSDEIALCEDGVRAVETLEAVVVSSSSKRSAGNSFTSFADGCPRLELINAMLRPSMRSEPQWSQLTFVRKAVFLICLKASDARRRHVHDLVSCI